MRRSTFTARSLVTAASFATFSVGRPARAASAEPVTVLYAASLVTAMVRSVVPALSKQGLTVNGEPGGSIELAHLISSGLRQPDVFISAEPKVITALMVGSSPLARWSLTFATTRLVIGYSARSRFAGDFVKVKAGTKKLVDVLLEPGLRLGRTDPVLDPKGYRTIIAAKLLGRHAQRGDFSNDLLGASRNAAQIFPEATLLARLEAQDVDAAFLYSTEAVARDVPYVDIPAYANLGDPKQASNYATASVTVDGKTYTGGVAAYALTIPLAAVHPTSAARFCAYLFSADGRDLLTGDGITMVTPAITGDRNAVPRLLLDALSSGR